MFRYPFLLFVFGSLTLALSSASLLSHSPAVTIALFIVIPLTLIVMLLSGLHWRRLHRQI